MNVSWRTNYRRERIPAHGGAFHHHEERKFYQRSRHFTRRTRAGAPAWAEIASFETCQSLLNSRFPHAAETITRLAMPRWFRSRAGAAFVLKESELTLPINFTQKDPRLIESPRANFAAHVGEMVSQSGARDAAIASP